MSVKEFNQDDFEIISREYADLKEAARKRCGSQEELQMVHKAFEFANEAHKGVRRRSGEPYILHPIAVAKIVVSNIGLGYKSIIAALLHDVVEDTNYTIEDIERLFGERVAIIVDGLTKIKIVLDKEEKRSIQAENFKRILLTLNEDVRVVLIKLADRLHNCRTIEFMPEHKRDKILSETMFVFIPLAHRLGLAEVKSEMEDIWLRYKEPEAFNDITARINRSISDKEKEINYFIKPIKDALQAEGFDVDIKKRVKTPYSIWNKMIKKNINFDDIYDLYAVRIILKSQYSSHKEERDRCYQVFSVITNKYTYKQERVRDWIKSPKNNGYEALHCTLMSKTGVWIEVQIRTARMNDIAEKGIAAHWLYKQGGFETKTENEMDKWITRVKDILVNPDVNALDLLDIIHNDLTSTDIIVFTPKGDERRMTKGHTALDFAYSIHSAIGNKAIAAKANATLVPLSYVLKTGDQIEIVTAETAKPKREWLQFVKSRTSKNRITDYLSNERQSSVKIGKSLIEEKLKEFGYSLDNKSLHILMKSYQALNIGTEEFYFKVGANLINIDNISEVLKERKEQTRTWAISKIFSTEKKNEVTITGESSSKHIIASCCKPIPGDNIVGFISSDGLITIHKKSCKIANSLAAKYGNSIVNPKWEREEGVSFLARISLQGIDRIGIINEITRYISLIMSVNIRKFTLESNEGVFVGVIDLYVNDRADLDRLITKLNKIDGIKSVVRSEI